MKDGIDIMREVHEADQEIGLRGAGAVVKLLESKDPGGTYYARPGFSLTLDVTRTNIFRKKWKGLGRTRIVTICDYSTMHGSGISVDMGGGKSPADGEDIRAAYLGGLSTIPNEII